MNDDAPFEHVMALLPGDLLVQGTGRPPDVDMT